MHSPKREKMRLDEAMTSFRTRSRLNFIKITGKTPPLVGRDRCFLASGCGSNSANEDTTRDNSIELAETPIIFRFGAVLPPAPPVAVGSRLLKRGRRHTQCLCEPKLESIRGGTYFYQSSTGQTKLKHVSMISKFAPLAAKP